MSSLHHRLLSEWELAPSIRKYGFEGLEDEPSLHRWRAQWFFAYSGECDGIWLSAYPVLRTTRCGAWINVDASRQRLRWAEDQAVYGWEDFDASWMRKRFVHDGSQQAWAKPTQEQALHSLAVRLTRWSMQVRRSTERVRSAAQALTVLRPADAGFAETAVDNLKGVESDLWF